MQIVLAIFADLETLKLPIITNKCVCCFDSSEHRTPPCAHHTHHVAAADAQADGVGRHVQPSKDDGG